LAAKRKTKKRTTKRRATKSRSKAKKKSKSKSKGNKKPFGGYAISFSGRSETVEDVFGKGAITPSEMTKRIWKFVKAKKLSNR
jgi:chromatin remodeling complex protein RSC6